MKPIVSANEKIMFRELGKRMHEIASDPVNETRKKLWKDVNGLKRVRPPVFIFEIPWHEMEYKHELAPVTVREGFLRDVEILLRRTIYQWTHLPGDMVVEDVIDCPPVVYDTGFGLEENVDVVMTDKASPVVSRHFNIQIKEDRDIEKIKDPRVTYDRQATEERFRLMGEIFDGVIPVRKTGIKGTSIAPWDFLVRLTGIEEILMDMHERPDYVHRLIGRLTDAYLSLYDQYEALNLFALNNDNTHLGGGYGYTDELPAPGYTPGRVRPRDMWGRAMAQIFSGVSPAMHEEFALRYEMKYLQRFGLVYYGCCEPLHNKISILRRIPGLRKISMSPWINVDEAARNVGRDFVFSHKPNPAFLAGDIWDPEIVRKDLRSVLDRTRGCAVEIILKDISTVGYEPRRLWEWARIASGVAAECG